MILTGTKDQNQQVAGLSGDGFSGRIRQRLKQPLLNLYLGQVFRMPLHTDHKPMFFVFNGLNHFIRFPRGNSNIPAGVFDGLIVQRIYQTVVSTEYFLDFTVFFQINRFSRQNTSDMRGFGIKKPGILIQRSPQ